MRAIFTSLLGFVLALTLAPGLVQAAGPTEIKHCTTITQPGAYVLARNLTTTGSCIVIAADYVSLDLGGFAIIGDGSTGDGIGTDACALLKGFSIQNGTVAGFHRGIGMDCSSEGIIRGVRVLHNATDGILVATDTVIEGSVTSGNGNRGIVTGPGTTVRGNVALNTGFGISVMCPSLVTENTADVHPFPGPPPDLSTACTITNNAPSGP